MPVLALGGIHSQAALLALQRSAGNRAVGSVVQRSRREALQPKVNVVFPTMTVVHNWWIQPGTKGLVEAVPNSGDVTILLRSGEYAGERVQVSPAYVDVDPRGALAHVHSARSIPPDQLSQMRGTQRNAVPAAVQLPPEVLATLEALATQFAPKVALGLTKKTRERAGLSLEHTVTHPKGEGTKLRLARFVRAAKLLNGSPRGRSAKFEVTLPGYVSWSDKPRTNENDKLMKEATDAANGKEARTKLLTQLIELLSSSAAWSFDGPHKEDSTPGGPTLTNTDTPGNALERFGQPVKDVDLPFVIATEFLVVIYDQTINAIQHVERYRDSMARWSMSEAVVHARSPADLA